MEYCIYVDSIQNIFQNIKITNEMSVPKKIIKL